MFLAAARASSRMSFDESLAAPVVDDAYLRPRLEAFPNTAIRMTQDTDDMITKLVQALAADPDVSGAISGRMIERLRRMEDEARLNGTDRQTLQRIMSARRVLGDWTEFETARVRTGVKRGTFDSRGGRA